MKCPKCKANKWLGGPEGCGSQNILCANCHAEYCESVFGLEPMEYNADRIRNIYGIYVAETPKVEPQHSIIDSMIEDII